MLSLLQLVDVAAIVSANRCLGMRLQRFVLVMAAIVVSTMSIDFAQGHPASGIAVDDQGNVFFVDSEMGVWCIDAQGKRTLVSESAMHFMAMDRTGKFANTPSKFGKWFGRLTPKGEKPTLISCSDFPSVVGKDGNIYYAHMHSLKIMRRTPEGMESVLVTPERFGIDTSRPIGVNGMACGPDGTIYVVSLDSLNRTVGSGEHALYAIALDGSIRIMAKNFVAQKLPESERHPEVRPEYCRGMAVDEQQNIFVAVTGSRCVMKLTPKGRGSVVLEAEKPWSPTGVDVSNGEIYVLEYDDETPAEARSWPLRVRKVGKDGKVETIATVRDAE
jgi:sugar lactone lactonase YvrE